jgi:thiol:disulfide interchange protein DsbD
MESLHQVWSLITHSDATRIKELALQNSALVCVVCFFSGILTSLTPCVYPMIPITINIFGRASQGHKRSSGGFDVKTFGLSAIYVAGMCATYSIMGLVAGLTGSLFGKVLQSSYMLGFLTVLFGALALGQLGLFKVALPPSMQTKLSQFGTADNALGIFLMGLFSGLIVSPCVGPVIAGILAFVVDSSNAFKGFLFFFSFSLGLGMLFLLIGGFSGLLSSLPRSGAWMNRVNRVLAFLMLLAAGYYGTVWAKQVGVFGAKHSDLAWLSDETAAYSAAAKENKPILVDFTAVWCAACHELDEQVFSDPKVTERLSAKYVLLRIDVSEDNEVNTAKQKKYNVLSLPTVLFISPKGEILEQPRVNGLLPPADFLEILNKVSPVS